MSITLRHKYIDYVDGGPTSPGPVVWSLALELCLLVKW